jgi:hypothetical protein
MVGNLMDKILEITNDEWIDVIENLDSRSYLFEYKDETYKVEENIEEGDTVVKGYAASIVRNISTNKYFAIQEKHHHIYKYELYNVLEVFPETVTITVYNTKRN